MMVSGAGGEGRKNGELVCSGFRVSAGENEASPGAGWCGELESVPPYCTLTEWLRW